MPRNSSGVYSLPAGNPVVTLQPIRSPWANSTMPDIAQALTDSLTRNGAAAVTGNQNMATFRHINVGDAQATNDYVAAGQVQSGYILRCTDEARAAGDAYSATLPFGGTSFLNGQMIVLKFPATNTGTTPTLNINGSTAWSILREDGSTIVVGDCRANVPSRLMFNGTSWLLLGAVVSATSVAGVSSWNGRTGAVVLTSADIIAAQSYVPANKAGDTFTGAVTLPGNASLALHATPLQQVQSLIAAIPTGGVNSWNGRTGAVTMTGTDVVSALTYTPANVTGPFRPGDGTAAAPIYSFAAATNMGIYRDASYVGGVGFAQGGVFKCAIGSSLGMASDFRLYWHNPGLTAADLGLARIASGTFTGQLEVNAGTAGGRADVACRSVYAASRGPTTPSISFEGDYTTGFYLFTPGYMGFSAGGALQVRYQAGYEVAVSTVLRSWADPGFTTHDIGLGRNAAGVLEVNNGLTPGQFRDLRARNITALQFNPGLFQTPGAGSFVIDYANGMSQYIPMTAAVTITAINNVPPGSIIRLAINGLYNGALIWPGGVVWPASGTSPPNLAVGPSGWAIVVLESILGAFFATYVSY